MNMYIECLRKRKDERGDESENGCNINHGRCKGYRYSQLGDGDDFEP